MCDQEREPEPSIGDSGVKKTQVNILTLKLTSAKLQKQYMPVPFSEKRDKDAILRLF